MCLNLAFLRRFSLLLVIEKKSAKQAKIKTIKNKKEYNNPRYCIDKYIATAKNKLVNPDKSDAFL